MKKIFFSAAAISISAALLSVSASADQTETRADKKAKALFQDDERRGAEVTKLCFVSQIDGFSNQTERAIIIQEGTKEYLVTTSQRCTALEFTNTVNVDASFSCLRRGDLISGCFVDKIYEWDS